MLKQSRDLNYLEGIVSPCGSQNREDHQPPRVMFPKLLHATPKCESLQYSIIYSGAKKLHMQNKL